jgi:naphthalene 1,2-dioxygenase ferredoxin component
MVGRSGELTAPGRFGRLAGSAARGQEDRLERERWIAAARRDELQEDDVVGVTVEGREVALYLLDGKPHATDNLCTHGQARLSDGFVLGDCVECPLHQGQFDIRTGKPLCAPVTEPIRVYRARFSGDSVEIDVGTGPG